MKSKVIAILLLFAAAVAVDMASIFLLALPFKWLSNALLPRTISAFHVDYFQSVAFLGLLMIIRVAVKGVSIKAKLRNP
jgi:hypothetical protein